MQYREMGKTGKQVSVLGFGMMRLPILDNDVSKIDEKLSMEMVSYAIDNGVNYLDTAYPYHKGMSEHFTAKVLNNGYRDKVYIADKLPSWLIKEKADLDKYLHEQLTKLGVEKIDFYLLHTLNKRYWEGLQKADVLNWLEEKKSEGLIGHAGFSFHDKYEVFEDIMSAYDWEFCQIQYNYMDREFQAGKKGFDMAAARAMGLIIMEPLRGGLLAKEPPQDVKDLMAEAGYNDTPASLGLRWVWEQREVSLLLSGMSTIEQVKENVKLANEENITMTAREQKLVCDLRDYYLSRVEVPCTKCEYCLPCPQQVAIPSIFNFYNTAKMYDAAEWGRKSYSMFLKADNRADKCVECGICESKCPQQIPIISMLKKAHEFLGTD